MAVREFKLINENDEEYSLMDIKNYCLLTDISGLGMSYDISYAQVSNTYIVNQKTLNQNTINRCC